MFASAYLVPYKVIGTYAPPVPLELGFQPSDTSLQFPTNSLHCVSHRNWIPYSWDASGSASAGVNVGGFTASPGPVSGSNPVVPAPAGDVFAFGSWEPTGFGPRKVMPDFSLPSNPRRMINWLGQGSDEFYPMDSVDYIEGVYPVFWDEFGLNSTGWYIEVRFRLFATIQPYTYRHNDTYFCEQEIRVDVSIRGVPYPGAEPPGGWLPAEGTNINFLGGGGTTRDDNPGRQAVGQASIRDQTNKDPVPNWGSATMYGSGFPCSVTLLVVGNHLPRPDYS